MKLLLDTCAFLWIITGADEISTDAKKLFSNPENEIYLSSISMWEIMIKHQLGRLPFRELHELPEEFIIKQRKLHKIESLPLLEEATIQLLKLPEYHKDPFDRMIICQSIAHDLTLLTPDKEIRKYPVKTIW